MAAADERTRGGTGYAHEPGQHHERRLKASHDALERANQELESRLAELYFMHEFLRALTAYHRVEDVSALIADGATGILGAEIAAVYLLDTDACRFRLAPLPASCPLLPGWKRACRVAVSADAPRRR